MLSALEWAILIAAAGLQIVRLGRVLADARRGARPRHVDRSALADMFSNPLVPALSLVVVVRSHRTSLTADVRALLGARYPQLEVVLALPAHAADASAALAEAFGAGDGPVRTAATGTLTLVTPGADALAAANDALAAANAALAVARHPLVCVLSDEWRPDDDALLRLARPFVDDDEATGATLTPSRRRPVVGFFRRADILEAGGLTGDPLGVRELGQRIGRSRRERGLGAAIVEVPDAIVQSTSTATATSASAASPAPAIDRLAALQVAGGAFVLATVAVGAAQVAWLILYALVVAGLGAVVSLTRAAAAARRPPSALGAGR